MQIKLEATDGGGLKTETTIYVYALSPYADQFSTYPTSYGTWPRYDTTYSSTVPFPILATTPSSQHVPYPIAGWKIGRAHV